MNPIKESISDVEVLNILHGITGKTGKTNIKLLRKDLNKAQQSKFKKEVHKHNS
jgi:hypothetical protein